MSFSFRLSKKTLYVKRVLADEKPYSFSQITKIVKLTKWSSLIFFDDRKIVPIVASDSRELCAKEDILKRVMDKNE